MSVGVPVEHLGLALGAVSVGLPALELVIRPLTAAQRCVARELALGVLAAGMLSPWVRPIAPFGTDLTIQPAWLGLFALPGLLAVLRWIRAARTLSAAPVRALGTWDGVPVGEADTRSPMVFGALAPRIVLPRGASGWPAEHLAATRAHELAHVARGDLLRWPVLLGFGVILGFHPFFHASVARWLRDAERAADRRATRTLAPAAYARALLELHARPTPGGLSAGSAFCVLRPSDLTGRVEDVLRPAPPPAIWRFAAPSALLAAQLGFVGWVPHAPPPPVCAPSPDVPMATLSGWETNGMLDFQHKETDMLLPFLSMVYAGGAEAPIETVERPLCDELQAMVAAWDDLPVFGPDAPGPLVAERAEIRDALAIHADTHDLHPPLLAVDPLTVEAGDQALLAAVSAPLARIAEFSERQAWSLRDGDDLHSSRLAHEARVLLAAIAMEARADDGC